MTAPRQRDPGTWSREGIPTLEVEHLVKHFSAGSQLFGGGGVVHAVDDVSFTIGAGEMLGLVGESGSGKSTVANCVLRLTEPTAGTIRLNGTDVTHLSRRAMRPLRRARIWGSTANVG